MLKIQFINATVEDTGYGVRVNGKDLDTIISTALGTKLGNKGGYGSGLPDFEANSCDLTIIINPHPTECIIETDKEVWKSVEEMEEDKREQFAKETPEAES